MVNFDVGDYSGQYTVHDARRLLDEYRGPPRDERAVTWFVSGVEQRVQGQLNDVLKAGDAELQTRADLLDDLAIGHVEDARKVVRRLKSGRITAGEARKEVIRLDTAKRELNERMEQLRHDEASLQAMAEMDLADYEAGYLSTTPALKRQLPVFTAEYLNQP